MEETRDLERKEMETTTSDVSVRSGEDSPGTEVLKGGGGEGKERDEEERNRATPSVDDFTSPSGIDWNSFKGSLATPDLNLEMTQLPRQTPLSPFHAPRFPGMSPLLEMDAAGFSLGSSGMSAEVESTDDVEDKVFKLFVYGTLRPDLDSSNRLRANIFTGHGITIEKGRVESGAFLFKHKHCGDARAIICSNLQHVSVSKGHDDKIYGSLISCVDTENRKKSLWLQKLKIIDKRRGVPFNCTRRMVTVHTLADGVQHIAYMYDHRKVQDLNSKSAIFRQFETEEVTSPRSPQRVIPVPPDWIPIMSGDWEYQEPKWVCISCNTMCESMEVVCWQCSLPRSKNSLPIATLCDIDDGDGEDEIKSNEEDVFVAPRARVVKAKFDSSNAATIIKPGGGNARLREVKAKGMLPIAYAYDERMEKHKDETSDELDVHPERPMRTRCIFEHLRALGLLGRLRRCDAREATESELLSCHSSDHVTRVLNSVNHVPVGQPEVWGDVYCCQHTAMAAVLSAGTTVALTEMILRGSVRSGVAIVRPPGHHAEHRRCMGFCFFNNVAVAAHTAKSMGAKRILILDWDVHHGNGTQHMFESDPDVLYISLHRGDNFYPGTGHSHEIGVGAGLGRNINIAWKDKGYGDPEYLAAFWSLIMPVATSFSPDLVIVSAGFDAAVGDPLGQCNVTPIGYAHMTEMLKSLANGRVLIVLEGGYNLRSIARSVEACVRSLIAEDPLPRATTQPPKMAALDCISKTICAVAPYWDSLRLMQEMMIRSKPSYPTTIDSLGNVRSIGYKRRRTWSEERSPDSGNTAAGRGGDGSESFARGDAAVSTGNHSFSLFEEDG